MDWTAPVDIYCERMGPEFWAEPWNAVTNASFILAALWGAWAMRAFGVRSVPITILTVLAFCIGIGSFLFHTFAQAWSGAADVIPIWLFVLIYILTCVNVVGGVSWPRVLLGFAGVVAIIVAAVSLVEFPALPAAPDWMNGSEQYLPAVAAMMFFSALTLIRGHPLRWWFTGATALFFLSLTFRTLDVHVCDGLPLGTHFLWHTLNGAVIALLLQALIRHHARLMPGGGAATPTTTHL
ncbi:ceramidase [Litoreibacter ponti]|uniref:Ceramidase n=1 Tax=Litoreibacter ponti TaxID=1510457 RepID=A0A2T6BE03_9RHOB|nr:ceramidase domain-containing protein [Litoreibacter ponti]PTX54300.1 ceramidase [Litoreibacter ponti]